MSPKGYVTGRALVKLRRWWLPLAMLVLATVIMAIEDSRFVYVMLMELLVAFPMVLCLVWMSEALSDDAIRETSLHTVSLSPDGITVYYVQPGRKPQNFSWSKFSNYQDTGKCVILQWTDRKRSPLRMPEEIFDTTQWHRVADILARNLK